MIDISLLSNKNFLKTTFELDGIIRPFISIFLDKFLLYLTFFIKLNSILLFLPNSFILAFKKKDLFLPTLKFSNKISPFSLVIRPINLDLKLKIPLIFLMKNRLSMFVSQ